jgi:hypothetical protein
LYAWRICAMRPVGAEAGALLLTGVRSGGRW